MNKKILEHKGFQGSVDFSLKDNVLFGKILHIDDLVTFEGDDVQGLNAAFIESVDDYLETCAQLGTEPNRPYSGTFNVRIGPALHRDLVRQSTREGKGINDFVKEAIDCHLNGRHQEIHHHYNELPGYETSFTVLEKRPAQRVHLRAVK